MKLRDFLQWGEQALALRHADLAEEIARYVLKQSPSNLDARTLLGRVHLKSHQFAQAEEQLTQALDMDPENVALLTVFAELLEIQGREEDRLVMLSRAFECDPARVEIKQRLLALRRKEEGEAGSNGSLTRAGLARIHLRSGLLEHAIAELRFLLEKTEAHWSAQVALMEAYWLSGDRQATSRLADEIVREHPNCLKAVLLSADVRAHMGLIDQARQLLERARQIDPDFALARALYPANGPSRLPLPSDGAEIDVPIDFLQRIEAALAAESKSEESDARTRAAARLNARTAESRQEDRKRILVTPAQSSDAETVDAEVTAPPVASEPTREERESADDPESWEDLLRTLEREGGQLNEAALDTLASRLETIAASATNKLQAWQQLGDVYHRIEQTDRAMRAYVRALDSTSAQQE